MKVTRNLLVVLMLLLFCNSAKSISVSQIVKVGGISYKVTYVNTSGGYFNADVYKSDNSGFVTIPKKITYDGLTGVVTGILGSAFQGETDLTKVSIPESVSVIDGGAFYCCRNLRTVVFDGTSRLKTIGYQAFGSCNTLNTFEIPNSVTTIEQGAFSYCDSLTSVTIPSSVQSFGLNTSTSTEARPAFFQTNGLKAIYVLNPEPIDISEMEFELKNANNNETIWSIANTVTLYVPRGSKEKYAAAKGWNVFTNIVETGDDVQEPEPDPEPDPNDDTDISAMEDVLYIINSEGFVGSSVTLSLNLKHAMDVSAFQANLFLPEGLEIEKITRGDELKVQDDNEEYIYTFNNSKQEDGSRFLLCYSVSNTPMTVGDINVAKITIKIPEGTAAGSYPIILKNVEMSYGSENKLIDYVKSTLIVNDYLPGDANGDSRISVTDISSIASYLLGTTPSAFVEKAADANGDSRVSVTDISSIAAKLLGGSSNAKTVHIEFDE